MSEELSKQPEEQNPLARELNDLLVALGATGQRDINPNGLMSISRGYRQWLAQSHPNSLQFIKPQQFWYVIVHVPQPGGGVGIAKVFTELHPVDFVESNDPGAIIVYSAEISEEIYLKHREPKRILQA